MTSSDDRLRRELEALDPVRPGELEDALDRPGATELLDKVLSVGTAPAARARRRSGAALAPWRSGGRRAMAVPAALAAAAAAVVVGILAIGLPGAREGRGDARLDGALDSAAAAAAAQPQPAAYEPYTFLKTRELALATQGAGEVSWSVDLRTTREEWVGWDGSGRLRVSTAPPRFAAPADRARWEAAGREAAGISTFVGLGSERRSEDHWLTAGLLDPSVEELPTEPAALAARLRGDARREAGGLPVAAAMLQSTAEDLRNPAASPELRQALYEAARRVPGIEYLGATTDPEGRRGIAIGVSATYAGAPARYALIFDPDTARLLATETTASGADGAAGPEAPTVLRAQVYLGSRGTGSTSRSGNRWVSDFGAPTYWRRPTTPFLVYRVPDRNPWSDALDAAYREGARWR